MSARNSLQGIAANPMSIKYSKGSGVWESLNIADGTKVYDSWYWNYTYYWDWISWAKSGNVSWEIPGDWATDTVNGVSGKYWIRISAGDIDDSCSIAEIDIIKNMAGLIFSRSGNIDISMPLDWEKDTVDGDEKYWLRLSVSVALSATVDIAGMTLTKQVFAKVIDTESYNTYGSEYYDHKIVDASLKTDEVAEQAGVAFLEQYAMALKSGKLTLHAEGLEIGQQVPITNSLRGLSSSYVVEETIITIKGNTFHVDVKWGDYKPGLSQIINDLRQLENKED